MKKILSTIFALMLSCALVACNSQTGTQSNIQENSQEQSSSQNESKDETDKEKMSLIATSFYQYDWLLQVLGEKSDDFDITLLVDNGTDLHNYEPTAKDILKIANADMFIYNGGDSDNWVEDVIVSGNKDLNAVSIIKILGESILPHTGTSNVDGEEHDHEHEDGEDEHDHEHEDGEDEHDHEHEDGEDEHDHEHEDDDEEHDHEHEDGDEEHDHENEDGDEDHEHEHEDSEEEHEHHHENDEHVWLSLENAETVTQALANEISKLDAENKEIYQANASAYIEKLSKLDDAYKMLVSGDVRDLIIFADRFPFAYLVDDYDLNYYAAFEGCSAESEASFETIAWLTDAANENDVNYLLIIESGTTDIANTIISGMNNKNCEVLILNSIQSVTKDQINNGTTYLSIMEENLEVLKLALAK